MTTYELMPNNPASHPLTGDQKIKQSIELISARRLSAGDIEFHLGRICDLYAERPADVVAPLAQRLLGAVLQLESVRADAIQKVLQVIQERGLWVEPAESAGGRAPGIEPAETYEEFVERNKIRQQIEALAERVEARPLAEHGELGNGRAGESRVDNVKSTQGGNSSEYQLRRLQRDRPDIYQRWKAGEFKSVRAACLAAGFAPVALTLTKDPFSSAQRIREQRGQDWINDLVEALSPGALSATQSAGEVRVFLEDLPPDRLRYVLSSLCSRRPEVLEQLLDDMDDDEEQLDLPLQQAQPTAKTKASSNGKADTSELRPVPAPGFYSATALAGAMGTNNAKSIATAGSKATADGEILRQLLADAPFKVLVHKENDAPERYEVLHR